MSLDIFSVLCLWHFFLIYLYISVRKGDVDRKRSMATTVLSIFRFPLQILLTNRPKYSPYIETFYPALEGKNPCREILSCTVGILCFPISLNLILINFSLLITTTVILVLNSLFSPGLFLILK